MITRYEPEQTDYQDFQMSKNPYGDYVEYSDYEDLASDYERLKNRYDKLLGKLVDLYQEG